MYAHKVRTKYTQITHEVHTMYTQITHEVNKKYTQYIIINPGILYCAISQYTVQYML